MKLNFGHLLCKIGIHKYKLLNDNLYHDTAFENLKIPYVKARRQCLRCNKLQEQEIHCLGMNPPKYMSIWFDLQEPEIADINGVATIFVDQAGALFVKDKRLDSCFSLKLGAHLGRLSEQGNYQVLGKYIISN